MYISVQIGLPFFLLEMQEKCEPWRFAIIPDACLGFCAKIVKVSHVISKLTYINPRLILILQCRFVFTYTKIFHTYLYIHTYEILLKVCPKNTHFFQKLVGRSGLELIQSYENTI